MYKTVEHDRLWRAHIGNGAKRGYKKKKHPPFLISIKQGYNFFSHFRRRRDILFSKANKRISYFFFSPFVYLHFRRVIINNYLYKHLNRSTSRFQSGAKRSSTFLP